MTPNETDAFYEIYERLSGQLQRMRWASNDESDLYFRALQVHPLWAVDMAADHLSRDGTRTGWFPGTDLWSAAADELVEAVDVDTRRALESGAEMRYLPLPRGATAQETKVAQAGIRDARARFLRALRKDGRHGIARYFKQLPVRGTAVYHCQICHDTGMAFADGQAGACECRDTNPVVQRMTELRTRLAARARRARRHAIA